jgi:hypothetical protein
MISPQVTRCGVLKPIIANQMLIARWLLLLSCNIMPAYQSVDGLHRVHHTPHHPSIKQTQTHRQFVWAKNLEKDSMDLCYLLFQKYIYWGIRYIGSLHVGWVRCFSEPLMGSDMFLYVSLSLCFSMYCYHSDVVVVLRTVPGQITNLDRYHYY